MTKQGYFKKTSLGRRRDYALIGLRKEGDNIPPINGEQISRYITKIRKERLLIADNK